MGRYIHEQKRALGNLSEALNGLSFYQYVAIYKHTHTNEVDQMIQQFYEPSNAMDLKEGKPEGRDACG